MGSEPKIDRLDKDDLKTLCCAAATMLADKEDEITMLRAQLAAAEARVANATTVYVLEDSRGDTDGISFAKPRKGPYHRAKLVHLEVQDD